MQEIDEKIDNLNQLVLKMADLVEKILKWPWIIILRKK